jgi:hypothetical protein
MASEAAFLRWRRETPALKSEMGRRYRPLAQSTARQGAMAAYIEAIELWIASSLTHMLFHGGPSRLDRRPKGTKADELCA